MALREDFIDYFSGLQWPEMVVTDSEIKVPSGTLLKLQNDSTYILRFHWRNSQERKYEEKNRPSIEFNEDFDIGEILYLRANKYDITYYALFKEVFQISDEIKKIRIESGIEEIKVHRGTLKISPEIILQIVDDLKIANREIKSHSGALSRYFSNKTHNKYFRKQIKETTTTKAGSFKFIIDRFNLSTKKVKKDYEQFLNSDDIESLQVFTEQLIKKEVFSEDYLRTLDEYFIKVKLKTIIELGRLILALKSSDLETIEGKRVVKLVGAPSGTKQLETLWQRYFEKNLLYLVFSYKKIYPKIELDNIDGDKKYPDFIGINHYNGIDIIEIKTHLANVLVWDSSHQNFSFSSEMSKAIIQTMNYMDAVVQRRFQDPNVKEKITNHTEEENLYHPRGIIIISSFGKLTRIKLDSGQSEKLRRDFTKLRNSLHNIEILTFDEVLQIADDYIQNIQSQP